MLEELDVSCCKAIIGGQHFSFERISDVPDFMNDVHRLLKRNIMNDRCQWTLSEESCRQDHGWAGHGAFANISVTVMIHLSTRAKSTG
eukprot:scaffold5908_cov152-Skeletonema_marinoi.AAC.5